VSPRVAFRHLLSHPERERSERRANGRYTHTLNLTPLLPYLKTSTATQKKPYQASDIPSSLSRNPIEEEGEKGGLLSFLVKGLLLALEVHPIMRSRVKFSGDEKWLEVGRDGIVGVAVSGMSSQFQSPPPLSSKSPALFTCMALEQLELKPRPKIRTFNTFTTAFTPLNTPLINHVTSDQTPQERNKTISTRQYHNLISGWIR